MLVSIVYASTYGHTAKLAQAVETGALQVPGTEVNMVDVGTGQIDWAKLEASNAIIFGSPTYMGSLSAKLKQFFEDSSHPVWNGMKWRNKIAAGFTNSGSLNGDKLNTLITMALFAAQNGMIWVGLDLPPGDNSSKGSANDLNRLGSSLGAMAQSNVDQGPDVAPPPSDLATAAYLGERVVKIAQQFSK